MKCVNGEWVKRRSEAESMIVEVNEVQRSGACGSNRSSVVQQEQQERSVSVVTWSGGAKGLGLGRWHGQGHGHGQGVCGGAGMAVESLLLWLVSSFGVDADVDVVCASRCRRIGGMNLSGDRVIECKHVLLLIDVFYLDRKWVDW